MATLAKSKSPKPLTTAIIPTAPTDHPAAQPPARAGSAITTRIHMTENDTTTEPAQNPMQPAIQGYRKFDHRATSGGVYPTAA